MIKYVADFETTTREDDCRVWGYGITEIGKPYNFKYGNSIDDFMSYFEQSENSRVYMHNLRFDGIFIINWLDANGFKFVRDRRDAEDKTYTALITNDNIYFRIEVYFERDKAAHTANRVVFYDSLKILNSSVEQIAKDFHFEIQKGHIDYKKERGKGHRLTTEEISYIRNDVEIVAMALNELFKAGVDKNTIAASAMEYYKTMQPAYGKLFPRLPKEIDDEIRMAYKGGFTYLNPKYRGVEVGTGIVLDCNSEYPSMMASQLFPVGIPKIFNGEYKYDPRYPLYILSFSCAFELKKGKIPTVQIKDSPYYDQSEYIESSEGAILGLIMTSVDFELFKENYDIYDLKVNGGYKFKAHTSLFTDYVNHWNELKIKSKIDQNYSMLQVSKKMLNSLYGRFGARTRNILKEPIKMEDNLIHFVNFKKDDRRAAYCAVAAFTTAYGRRHLVKTIEKVREWSFKKYNEDLYIYSDTDSVKIELKNEEDDIQDLKKIIDIHKYKLGAWKIESQFNRAKYLRGKAYIEEEKDGHLNVVIAGFPKNLAPLLNFDNFNHGFTTKEKTLAELIEMAKKNGATDEQISKISQNLKYRYVKGGVILEETSFTLK